MPNLKMLKRLSIFLFLMLFYLPGFSQVKEIIDRDISLIKYVPDGKYFDKNWKKIRRINKRYRKKNHEYHEILSLDTIAIPYLVDKISDTTETSIKIPCSTYNLKAGDVAFALLNNIIWIPMHAVTGSQWDSYSCDSLPDGTWEYLHNDRLRFQKELKLFFASSNGKIWVRLFKEKLSKTERSKLTKELKFN